MLIIDGITVKYGENTVLDSFFADLSQAGITALCGPSGCGKTTLLNVVAGFVKPQIGDVKTDKTPAFMFQQPRLFPWLTALQNVNVVLDDNKDSLPKAKRMLEMLGFFDFDKYPAELSGGMQQRVALARTLVSDGDLLLLDEPLSALDKQSKQKLLQIIKNDGRQILFVTHDPEDTIIADKIINM